MNRVIPMTTARLSIIVGRVAKALKDGSPDLMAPASDFIDEAAAVMGVQSWEFFPKVAKEEAMK